MSDKKHIDRLFQEKFKDFNQAPNPEVWANIEKQLASNKATSSTIPLWLKLSSAAAVLLLFSTLAYFYSNSSKTSKTTVVVSDIEQNNAFKDDVNASTKNKTINSNNKTKVYTTNHENKTNTENSLPLNELVNTKENELSSNLSPISSTEINNSNKVSTTNLGDKNKPKNSRSNYKSNTLDQTNNSIHLTANTSNNNEAKNLESTLSNKKTETNNILSNAKKPTSNSKESNTKTAINKSYKNTLINTKAKTTLIATAKNKRIINTHNNPLGHGESNTNFGIKNRPTSNYVTGRHFAKKTGVSRNSKKNSLNQYEKELHQNLVLLTKTQPLTRLKTDALQVTLLNLKDTNSIEAAIAENQLLLEKEAIGKRWAISPNIAPVYYNSFGKGSQFHDQFINNKKSGETNTSYGITVGYAIDKDFRIRTGIHQVNLSYDTDNVIVFESVSTTPNENPLKNITFYNQISSQGISVISNTNLTAQQISSTLNENFNAALSQRIQYIEIPVELEYRLSKERFGINIIGGFSSFILSDNQVVSEFDGYNTELGKANNINSLSFSTNIGIGLNYSFSKSFVYNFEPTFKYQINGFSNTSGRFNPYIIGVYTGFSYKF